MIYMSEQHYSVFNATTQECGRDDKRQPFQSAYFSGPQCNKMELRELVIAKMLFQSPRSSGPQCNQKSKLVHRETVLCFSPLVPRVLNVTRCL